MKYIKQRISREEKEANDQKWAKDMIDSLEDYAGQDWTFDGRNYDPNSRMEMMLRGYKLYNSEITTSDIENVFNPLGIEIGQRKDEIIAYNKMYTKINTLIGELIKRPFNLKAILITDERAAAVKEVQDKLIKEYLISETNKQIILTQLSQKGLPEKEYNQAVAQVEEQFAGVKNPEQIAEYIANEYLEPREIKANKILSLLIRKENVIEKKSDSFKHGLLSDEEHAWVGEVNGQVCVRVLNPLNMFYHKSPEVKYIQKGDYAGSRIKMSVADVMDLYRNLKPEDVKKLEDRYMHVNENPMGKTMHYNFKHLELNYAKTAILEGVGSYGYAYSEMVDVIHVEWRSQAKVYFVYLIDQEGNESTEILSEEMLVKEIKKLPGYMYHEEVWVPQIWEGTKIDNDIYVDIRPVPGQTINIEDPYRQDLRYHGIVYSNMNAKQISLAERCRPFQYLYFIVVHNLKKLIASDKGKLLGLDTTLIDPEMGLEKTLYYIDQLSIFPYNSLANAEEPGASQRSGAINDAVDRSNAQHIANYLSILDYLDQQIGEVLGVPRAREGQTTSQEAVTNAQQNIIQSSVVTEVIFNAHNKHWEKVLDSAVNLSIRLANNNGGNYSYLNESNKYTTISLKKEEFDNCDFNVFVLDSPQDNEIFRQLQSLAQPLLQNDKARFSHIIKLIKQKYSIEELTRDIEKFEQMSDQMAQQEAQSQQQRLEMQLQAEAAEKDKQREHELRLAQMEIEGKIAVAEIQSFARQMDQDINDNMVPDQLEIEKIRNEREKIGMEREKILREKEEAGKEREEREKDREHEKQMQEKEIEGKIKIEKAKPKPKPSGGK